MPVNRRDPFSGMEPAEELGLTIPTALVRPSVARGGRKTPVRPAERRRRPRQASLTFSSDDVIERLRRLAERWDLRAPNGSASISAAAEYLLRIALADAESGAIAPPKWGKK